MKVVQVTRTDGKVKKKENGEKNEDRTDIEVEGEQLAD